MPRKKLKRILPTYEKIKEQRFLKIFGNFLHKKEIWSLSRKKVLGGVLIGIFVCCIPMPFQMVLSSFLAILFNVNLPISFVLIFISNPLTMPFLFYVEYEVGNFILNNKNAIEFNFNSMYENLDKIALSLYTGSIIVGLVSSLLSVYFINFIWIRMVKKSRKSTHSYKKEL